jgi:hypothetical protein
MQSPTATFPYLEILALNRTAPGDQPHVTHVTWFRKMVGLAPATELGEHN